MEQEELNKNSNKRKYNLFLPLNSTLGKKGKTFVDLRIFWKILNLLVNYTEIERNRISLTTLTDCLLTKHQLLTYIFSESHLSI
jgi:hypothetical protein